MTLLVYPQMESPEQAAQSRNAEMAWYNVGFLRALTMAIITGLISQEYTRWPTRCIFAFCSLPLIMQALSGASQRLPAESQSQHTVRHPKAVLAGILSAHMAAVKLYDWPLMLYASVRLSAWLISGQRLPWSKAVDMWCVMLVASINAVLPFIAQFLHLFKPSTSR